jgi:hypothetical protein
MHALANRLPQPWSGVAVCWLLGLWIIDMQRRGLHFGEQRPRWLQGEVPLDVIHCPTPDCPAK